LAYIAVVDIFAQIWTPYRPAKRINGRILPAAIAIIRVPRLHEDQTGGWLQALERRLHLIKREGESSPIPLRATERIEPQQTYLIATERVRKFKCGLNLVRILAVQDDQDRGPHTLSTQCPRALDRCLKASGHAGQTIVRCAACAEHVNIDSANTEACQPRSARSINQRTVGPDGNEHFRCCVCHQSLEIVATKRLPSFKKNADETLGNKFVKELDPFIGSQFRIASSTAIGVAVSTAKIAASRH
jgi:hypothetical protein